MATTPDYVHRRWTRGRASRWLAAKPQRMLAWWAAVALIGLAAVVAMLLGGPLWLGAGILASALINLLPELGYVRRAWRAWRAPLTQ